MPPTCSTRFASPPRDYSREMSKIDDALMKQSVFRALKTPLGIILREVAMRHPATLVNREVNWS